MQNYKIINSVVTSFFAWFRVQLSSNSFPNVPSDWLLFDIYSATMYGIYVTQFVTAVSTMDYRSMHEHKIIRFLSRFIWSDLYDPRWIKQ